MAMISRGWHQRESQLGFMSDSEQQGEDGRLQRDTESGETLGNPVVILRKMSPKAPTINFEHHSLHERRIPPPLIQEHRLHRHFRIKEALRLAKLYGHFTKGPKNFGKKGRGSAKIPLAAAEACRNNTDSLPGPEENFDGRQHQKLDREVLVNIWEEFRYGSSVLNVKSSTPITHGGCEWARPFLANLLPKPVVDLILYILFFSVYFLSCCLYNNYLELGCYLLYDLHLRLHENAEKYYIKVKFIGSPFQGPMYCIIRMLCQHCHHYESNKVVLKLMKKMKQDVVDAYSSK
ncbi:uncharacterized protein [Macrobrachium rosenbergii]|uniref:uncharacterized protein n=1 Tax=Macrobrachium rosenbergii TaxID=79674 RepID=UPI0034D56846